MHRIAIMSIADISFGIDHAAQRHASQLKKVDFLPVQQGDDMVSIWQSNERDSFIAPVLLEGRKRIGAHSKDLHTATGKLIVLIAQARQLRAAVRSHKTAQECQQNGLATKIRKANRISLDIFQFKIRCQIPRCN